MKEEIRKIHEKIVAHLDEIKDLKEFNEARINYLGKKGIIQGIASKISSLPTDEKREIGILVNQLKNDVNHLFEAVKEKLEQRALEEKLAAEKIDISLPATKIKVGSSHPLTRIIDEIEELFVSMGYDVVEGPEIESDLYNFEKLNLAKDHPARDMQDSFYITEEMLLRTQTSPVQARVMEANVEKGPIRIICPGKVYRKDDDDATHSHQFTQIEGLVIDENINISHLKGTLEVLARYLFGEDRTVRFRPSFFPFTEPSLEVDVSCFKCNGAGCSICKGTGWIEILGAGMVHPEVLKAGGYDPEKYSGFAFGMGPERIAMLKYGINDIRHFYVNNINFLNNFNRLEKEDSNESK